MIVCVCANPAIDSFVRIDDLSPGASHRALGEERFPGGKGVHVALAAAELGAQVTLVGIWAGPTGEWVRQQCERSGVACRGPRVDGWTRTCLTFKSPGAYDDTELLGVGPEIGAQQAGAFLDEVIAAATAATCVTISGSLPRGCPTTIYADAVRGLRAGGAPTFLDCSGEPFSLALAAQPHAVHLNRSESASFFGVDDPAGSARELARRCGFAVVTAGADGAYAAVGSDAAHASCRVETVHSAVGSGDCLTAGLAVAHDRGLDWRQGLRLGVACGSANCLRPELGMLHRADVERLLTGVASRDLPV